MFEHHRDAEGRLEQGIELLQPTRSERNALTEVMHQLGLWRLHAHDVTILQACEYREGIHTDRGAIPEPLRESCVTLLDLPMHDLHDGDDLDQAWCIEALRDLLDLPRGQMRVELMEHVRIFLVVRSVLGTNPNTV